MNKLLTLQPANPTTYHFRNTRTWKDFQDDADYSPSNLEKIRNIIISYLGDCSKEQFHSKSRKGEFVLARHLFCYFTYIKGGYRLLEIVRFIGYNDHATVIHGRNAINDLLGYDKRVQRMVKELDERFNVHKIWD